MATVEVAVKDALSGYSDLTDLVDDRIYPFKLPQKPTFPAVVFLRIAGAREYSHSGDSDLSDDSIQVSVFSETYLAAKQILTQVRLALATLNAFVESVVDLPFELETRTYHIALTVSIWHKEG